MIKFILGAFVGGFVWMVIFALCVASGRNNGQGGRIDFDKETE